MVPDLAIFDGSGLLPTTPAATYRWILVVGAKQDADVYLNTYRGPTSDLGALGPDRRGGGAPRPLRCACARSSCLKGAAASSRQGGPTPRISKPMSCMCRRTSVTGSLERELKMLDAEIYLVEVEGGGDRRGRRARARGSLPRRGPPLNDVVPLAVYLDAVLPDLAPSPAATGSAGCAMAIRCCAATCRFPIEGPDGAVLGSPSGSRRIAPTASPGGSRSISPSAASAPSTSRAGTSSGARRWESTGASWLSRQCG